MASHIYWIGDSTVQQNRIDTWPQCGIGQMLEWYLRPGVQVHNYARNGRSTKSFWEEGRFEAVERELSAGDVLLIQFGHNDQKKEDPTRYSSPEDYQKNLLRYANFARRVGALPVLITPVTRRRFEGDKLTPSLEPYPQAMGELAQREGIPLIDLYAISRALIQQQGEQASRAFYMVFGPGEYPNYPQGREDNTHLRCDGALWYAGVVAEGLRALGGPYESLLL